MLAMDFFIVKNTLLLAMILVCVAQGPLVSIYRVLGHMPLYVGHIGWAYVCPFLHVFCEPFVVMWTTIAPPPLLI